MKNFLVMLLAAFVGCGLAIGAGAGLAYWRFMVWWNAPLGEPLPIGGAAALMAALQPDYKWFWLLAGLPFLLLLVWITISLHRIAQKR